KFSPTYDGKTDVVAPPYQVQVEKSQQAEKGRHRTAFVHYDFVYVFQVDRIKPPISISGSKEHKSDTQWYSVADVDHLQDNKEYGPHGDILPTMKKIVSELKLQGSRAAGSLGRRKK